jgi:hypothetical protein
MMKQYKKERELYHAKKFKVFLPKESILQASNFFSKTKENFLTI